MSLPVFNTNTAPSNTNTNTAPSSSTGVTITSGTTPRFLFHF